MRRVLLSLLPVLLGTTSCVTRAIGEDSGGQDYGIPQVAIINSRIRQHWSEWQLQPSKPATDGEWCRRVYLDVVGRVPTVAELRAFTQSRDTDKRVKLVKHLLYAEPRIEEYARNWTTLWTNILIGRNGGTERNTLVSRTGMQQYLRDSFTENKPYDTMVRELVTATGTGAPDSPKFNGAVNFLIGKVNEEKGSLATAATTRIFLGLQVQCTQCHNHPFNEWKQQKYWEMNAFFRQTRALRTFVPETNDIASAELIDEDFAGEGLSAEEAEVFYELRNGLTKVAFPVFVDGTEIGRSGYVSEVNRRQRLGDLLVSSEYLDKMIVNRMWAHFLGYGFTKPVNDMGPHNPPSHPALLNYLANEFRSNSRNLKELIRWIVLSEAYSLSSQMNSTNETDDPLLGEPPKFSHFYLRQMRAEELYESLLVATQAHKSRGSYEEQEKAKAEWLQQFVLAFGTDEGDETTTFNGTIPQALMMFNGDLIKQATKGEPGSFLHTIATSKLSPQQQIEYLFLAGLARKPDRQEIMAANKIWQWRQGDRIAALQDIWWAVLNSNEFILNH